MDLTVAVPIAVVLVPVLGGIVVERIRARAATAREIAAAVTEATKPFASAVAALEVRATKFEVHEPAELAKLRGDVHALAADLATVRTAYETRAREDDARRKDAGKYAREREEKQAAVMHALSIELARIEERLAGYVQEKPRGRR